MKTGNSSLARVSKRLASNDFDGWDYTHDGQFPTPLLKREDKRQRNKKRRRIEKLMVKKLSNL